MFRHQGKFRTHKHNLRIAVLLSLVAGMVNVSGFLAIGKLTTNVTGHFAFFIDDISRQEFFNGLIYLVYILSFLTGAFVSGVLIEKTTGRKVGNFVFPVLLESIILIGIGFSPKLLSADAVACGLLFSMGMQNALVTRISNAVVRTTHLTGLFTDLGIELSQLCFGREKKLEKTIMLRLNIIVFFFVGGLAGGYFFSKMGMHSLTIAAAILIGGLLFDHFRYGLLLYRRRRGIKLVDLSKKRLKKVA